MNVPASALTVGSISILAALLGIGIGGCGLQPKPSVAASAQRADIARGRVNYPFVPAELMVHPLTRIVTDPVTGARSIDGHFVLRDRWGDGVKALGRLSVELYGTSGMRERVQLLVWHMDLTDPDKNSDPFDRVTQTYRIVLAGLDTVSDQQQVFSIQAQFTTLDGRRLQATHRLTP